MSNTKETKDKPEIRFSMACGLVVLVSLLVLTSAVRPEATNPYVIDRQRRDHETAERFTSPVAVATEAVSPQVKRSAQTLSEDEIGEIPSSSSSSSSSSSANKADAPEVTSRERQHQNEMRTEGKTDVPTDKRQQNVPANRGEINKDDDVDDDDNKPRKEDKDPDARRKNLLKIIDPDSPLIQTTGNDVIVADSDVISRTRRDLRKLKRILEEAIDGTSQEDKKQPEEEFLPDGEGQEEGESVDDDGDVPQSDEATPGDASFRRLDFSKRPKYYPDWGPKRTWRINMMRVWGKRSVGELGGRVKYWNRK